MTREEYIAWVAPRIVLDSLERNLLPSPRIAQACFEPDFGTSELAVKANNLFGVKANDQWEGAVYNKISGECYNGKDYVAKASDFQAYDSWEDSIYWQGWYLENRCTTQKYHPELKHYAELIGNMDYKDCARILKEKGYGTSPEYDQRVIFYVEEYELTKYDSMTREEALALIGEKEEKKGMKILLTVGHSILKTGSCTSADGRPYGGVLEYSYNKGIVENVAEYLKSVGHDVDILICPELRFGRSTEEKNYKLNYEKAGNYDLVAELHLNATALHNARGCEVLYISDEGKKVAQRIQKELATVFKDRGIKYNSSLYMLKGTKAVAVLIESFFCDNSEDCETAEKTDVALLIAQGIHGNKIESKTDEPVSGFLYRVQTGAFRKKENADRLMKELKAKGFSAFVTTEDVNGLIYRVQVGAYGVKSNAENMKKKLKAAGFDAIIVQA